MSYAEEMEAEFEALEAYIEVTARRGIWTTKDGTEIRVEDMTDRHIANTIAFLERQNICDIYMPWISRLEAEQKRRETMTRYIDADRLRKDILGLPNCYNGFSDTYDKALIIDRIDEQPTADVRENVKGMWVKVVDRTEMYDKEGVKTWGMLFQCNQCGFVLNAIEGHTGQYNFCPNCGADMRGENNG